MELEKNDRKEIQLHQVFHMNHGDGDNSYAKNSLLQKKVMLKAKPILQESIVKLHCNNSIFPECITIADMGCSSGPNAFLPIWEIIEAIDETCDRLNRMPPALQMFLNDLPGNDFNSISKSLPNFYEKLKKEKGDKFDACFIAAVPGNFYRRLFPPHSLHFVHSSYSLHWFSEVPEIPLNKGQIWIAKSSTASVRQAFLNQFERDFTAFLKSRSEEMKTGGLMVLTFFGRDDINNFSDPPGPGEYGPTLFELLGVMLNDMVSQGLIEESKLDAFNLPCYCPSAEEIRKVIDIEKSFSINALESFRIGWDECIDDRYKDSMDKYTKGKHVANHIRAGLESILANHFGHEIIDVMFHKFSTMIGDYMERGSGAYTNIVVSLTKE